MNSNNGNCCIAIDVMGGDFGLEVTIPASLMALANNPNLRLMLVGNQVLIQEFLLQRQLKLDSNRATIVHCEQVVTMDDIPSIALRKKPDSSMRLALNLVKSQKAQACVSAGNTGALMAIARFVLKMMPGIDRPAILYSMPTIKNKSVSVLDLGANVDCSAEQLFQFAVMGSILLNALGIPNPTISLLNIGSEPNKGTQAIREAAKLIASNPELNYVGFIEGDAIYKGEVDIVVCDGFVGNVALKVTEGLAKLLVSNMKYYFNASLYNKIIGSLAKPILGKIFHKFNPNQYNGASLLGLNGTVIKSHGGADIKAFYNAISTAALEGQKNVPCLIREKVALQLGVI